MVAGMNFSVASPYAQIYRRHGSSVRCAHVCLSARLFPCAWRTLLNAGLVVHRSEDDGCHSEPKRSDGEESRLTGCWMRDSSAYGLRMTDPQNQCDRTLVVQP